MMHHSDISCRENASACPGVIASEAMQSGYS